MTALVTHFALIGRSFPSDAFQDLYSASISQRAERRRTPREIRAWRPSGDAVVVPARLRG